MIEQIKNSKITKVITVYVVFSMFFQIVYPTAAFALTGGPSQPEVQSFEPVGTSDMVDISSGDFNYNIPLMDVGGYPINISYHSGISMDQESSWVGLGWNINAGAITRNMRGLPDDFKGDKVVKKTNMRANRTFGLSAGYGAELLGLSTRLGMGIRYNNYSGLALESSYNASFQASKFPMTASLGINSSSNGGLSISPSVSVSMKLKKLDYTDVKGSLSIGTSMNSRQGVRSLNIGMGISESQHSEYGSKGYRKDDFVDDNGDKQSVALQGMNGGSSISFGAPSYTPMITNSYKNFTANVSIKAGVTVSGIDGTYDMAGYYSQQILANKSEDLSAYGYLYAGEASSKNVLMDFNREKDASFSRNTPALPLTNFTYDILSVSGQGVGGMYRPFRSDLGHIFDKPAYNTSTSINLGAEVKVGNLAQSGGDITVNDVFSYSGDWVRNNDAQKTFNFSRKKNNSDYEPVYFKQAGEKSVDDDDLYENIGKDKAVRFAYGETKGFDAPIQSKLCTRNEKEGFNISDAKKKRTKRVKRNQVISYLTAGDYNDYAVDHSYYSKFNSYAKKYHIAEITVLRPDGARYIYGLPAYITKHKEVTFNVTGREVGSNKALVSYKAGEDNSTENDRGIDHYFNSTETPSYAHSYMLTAVLSADYVDITGNGPSDDDYGTFTKFNYEKVANYKWRVPILEDKANYSEGLKTVDTDDKGNYIYGKKDLYYLSEIITKNYKAVFNTSDRKDGHGVEGENGKKDNTSNTKKLDNISLYAKKGTSTSLIKTVHFKYDYSLCQGISNTSNTTDGEKGKLTLKSLYFTYGDSKKAKFNDYSFSYNTLNPDYNIKGYDRWGNYKNATDNGNSLSNIDFPYTIQDTTITNKNASAWSLGEIALPSGGKIRIKYESDSYAYVQDRKAMQMFKIIGIGENYNDANGDITLNIDSETDSLNIFIKIPEGVSSNKQFRDYCLSFPNEMYFRVLAKVNKSTLNNGYEYVSGYCSIKREESGIYISSDSQTDNHAYIKVKFIDSSVKNPLAKAAIQFGRLNTPKKVYQATPNNADDNDVDIVEVLKSMSGLGFISNIAEMFQGPNKYLYDRGIGNVLQTGKSWVRLLNPTGNKLGGGVRVTSIKMYDNWDNMGTGSYSKEAITGQVYDYTTEEDGRTISSGVAQYEPMVGADENPFRMPVNMGNDNAFLAPDDRFYLEEPFGETFFPSPSIIYSKVTVKNLQNSNIKRHATGKVVHEFYTAKDFPIKTSRTDLALVERKSNFFGKLLKLDIKDYMHASQGFSIVLNDMHGKQKAQWVYAEGQNSPISGVEYFYKQKKIGSDIWELQNDAVVIDKEGTISTKRIGVDFDIIADFRQQKTNAINVGVSANFYSMMIGPIPLFLPPVIPSFSQERTRMQSASVTKVVNKYGILEKTVAYDLGSKVSVDNIAWDAETGEVLLTHTTNDFNDDVFSFNYPAHWAYDRMGMAYENIGYEFSISSCSNGSKYTNIVLSESSNKFVIGDELGVSKADGSGKIRVWVNAINSSSKTLSVVDINGCVLNNTYTAVNTGIKNGVILRSGRRNMQSTSIGSMTSTINPIDKNSDGTLESNIVAFDNTYKVLNASAVEYSDDWIIPCSCAPTFSGGYITNNFTLAKKGIWRQLKSHTYLTNRVQKNNSYNKIRNDGYYSNFNAFWEPNSGNNWTKNTANWTWVSEVTKYSPYSFELENKDALNRYSAAIYGYNNSLPIAVASNARYIEIGYNGFEDNGIGEIGSCNNLSNKNWKSANSLGAAHTGNHSLKLSIDNSLSSKTYIPSDPVYNNSDKPEKILNEKETCIGELNIFKGFYYILSAWVKVSNSSNLTTYDGKANITIAGTVLKPTGRIIDGWQKIEGKFMVTNNYNIILKNTSSEDVYFDDIRIFPFEASMKSYVYDNNNYRLMAELDNNNYATFYEYDEDGALVRVKKETERGIMTIKESRNYKTKINNND